MDARTYMNWNGRAKAHGDDTQIKEVPMQVWDGKHYAKGSMFLPTTLDDAIALEGVDVVLRRYVSQLVKEYQDQWRQEARAYRRSIESTKRARPKGAVKCHAGR